MIHVKSTVPRLFAAVFCLLSACYPKPAVLGDGVTLAEAAKHVAADLTHQIGFSLSSQTFVVDPMLDSRTGQQTEGVLQVQATVVAAFTQQAKGLSRREFTAEGIAGAKLVVSGVLTAQPGSDDYRLSVAIADRASGLVIAQSAVQFRQAGLSKVPTAFYRDSPSTVKDRSVQGYMKTADTAKGKPADALYIQQIPTAAILADALTAYNAEQWEEALAKYEAASQRSDGQQLRTFNGIYLTNIELGRMPPAKVAFGKIVALGLATNNLAVKLLFRPGTTEYWGDPRVSRHYPMWIEQIAQALLNSGGCLQIVGHTSASGSDATNERLSRARALAIRDALATHAPTLSQAAQVMGMGSRENIVGSGKDDASDALDRRVEFRMLACPE